MARKKKKGSKGPPLVQTWIKHSYAASPEPESRLENMPMKGLFDSLKKYQHWKGSQPRLDKAYLRWYLKNPQLWHDFGLFDCSPPQFSLHSRSNRRKNRRRPRARSAARGQQDPKSQENINKTACGQVFAITELAEKVFLNLSMADILCGVIRTCKHWNTVITNSTKLQQALFFKPIPVVPVRFSFEKKAWMTMENSVAPQVYEHPLLSRLNDLVVDRHISASLAGEMRMSPELVVESVKRHALSTWKAMRRPQASWQRALLSQPPVAHIYTANDGESHLIAKNKSGVVMGDVIPVVRSKGCRSWNFRKPALKLRGYNKMTYYESYGQLEELLQARKMEESKGEWS